MNHPVVITRVEPVGERVRVWYCCFRCQQEFLQPNRERARSICGACKPFRK